MVRRFHRTSSTRVLLHGAACSSDSCASVRWSSRSFKVVLVICERNIPVSSSSSLPSSSRSVSSCWSSPVRISVPPTSVRHLSGDRGLLRSIDLTRSVLVGMTCLKKKTKLWELPVNWIIVFFGNLAGVLCYLAFIGAWPKNSFRSGRYCMED